MRLRYFRDDSKRSTLARLSTKDRCPCKPLLSYRKSLGYIFRTSYRCRHELRQICHWAKGLMSVFWLTSLYTEDNSYIINNNPWGMHTHPTCHLDRRQQFKSSQPIAAPHYSPMCSTFRLIPSCTGCLHHVNGITDAGLLMFSPSFLKLTYLDSLSLTDS